MLVFPVLLASCSGQQSTNEKLEAEFDAYDQVKKVIAYENHNNDSSISRIGLEYRLGYLFSSRFSEEDISFIQRKHSNIIDKNRLLAHKNSIFDLNSIRNNESKLADFCRSLPKGGMLHVHPWGLFNRNVVRQLLERYDPVIEPMDLLRYIEEKEPGQYLYGSEIEMLSNLPQSANFSSYSAAEKKQFIEMFILPGNPATHDFERFDSIFAFVDRLLGNEERDKKILLAYSSFLKNAAKQGVSYVEFTEYFSPKIENISKLEKWAKQFLAETGIVVRWNLSFLRFEPARENADVLKDWIELLVKHPTNVITGIDLLSIEKGFPAFEAGQEIYGYLSGYNMENPDHPLEMTIHAGEMGDERNVRDALLMGATRIGHGVLLQYDPVTLEYARRMELPIETNIISNHKLGVHDMNAAPHPFLDYLRLGLRVSLSTDNDAIFETDIANECVAAITTTDIEYSELKHMSYNSVRTSFANDKTKEKLENKLNRQFINFEQKYLSTLND